MNAEKERDGLARPDDLLRIEGEMTIYQAADLKQMLLASLEGSGQLGIDLSAVTDIDTAGVQLLLASRASAQGQGKPWRLAATSDVVAEVFALLDIAGCFGDLPSTSMQAG